MSASGAHDARPTRGSVGATPDPDRIASRMLDYLDATHEVE